MLYAVGGYDGASRQCLSTVECYNCSSNEWTYVAEMGTRRSGAGEQAKSAIFEKSVKWGKCKYSHPVLVVLRTTSSFFILIAAITFVVLYSDNCGYNYASVPWNFFMQ